MMKCDQHKAQGGEEVKIKINKRLALNGETWRTCRMKSKVCNAHYRLKPLSGLFTGSLA